MSSFSKIIIFSILIYLYVAPINAKTNCDQLKLSLKSEQADSLCKAMNLKEDFSGNSLTDEMLISAGLKFTDEQKRQFRAEMDKETDGQPYTVHLIKNLGGNKSCIHPVVFLGERHIKFAEASKVGISVVQQFRFRGHEAFQKNKVKNLSSQSDEKLTQFGSMISELVSKKVLNGSTIYDEHQMGIVIADGNIEDFKNSRSFFSARGDWSSTYGGLATFLASGANPNSLYLNSSEQCWNPYATLSDETRQIIKSPSKFAAAFKDLLRDDKFAQFSFHLEEGELDAAGADCNESDSKSCEDFILKERNKNMAKHISEIVPNLPCGEPFLIVVGLNHSPGLVKLLNNTQK